MGSPTAEKERELSHTATHGREKSVNAEKFINQATIGETLCNDFLPLLGCIRQCVQDKKENEVQSAETTKKE